MLSCPVQRPLMESLLCSAVLLYCLVKSQSVHVVRRANFCSWEGEGVADVNQVGVVEEEKDG